MAIARVVTFDGVDSDRIQQMQQEMNEGERPDDIPATEIIVLSKNPGDLAWLETRTRPSRSRSCSSTTKTTTSAATRR